MPIKAEIPLNYRAGFFACNIPSGVTVTFSPQPATSTEDSSSSTFASARTAMKVHVSSGVPSTTYGLALYAYYEDPQGHVVLSLPGGTLVPRAALLKVNGLYATLEPTDDSPADNHQNCSTIPPGFQPTPQPTHAAADYTVNSWVSNPNPATGETLTVYTSVSVAGQPVPNATVTFTWVSLGLVRGPCTVVTGSNGIASCSTVNLALNHGLAVSIHSVVLYNGYSFDKWTSYTM
jgi:hypothetical protein